MVTPQQKPNSIAKTFVGNEILDGKTVNVVDGMKLYEELIDGSGVRKMVSLVNDLRAAGRRGQFQGHTLPISKRPTKGHGREMNQFGLTIVDEETITVTSKDRKMEPIPSLFQDFIDRVMSMQILTVKPASCIIDIYNEGDHSQPHIWPQWFGRSFDDGFPNLFINNAQDIRGHHVSFLASFSSPSVIFEQLSVIFAFTRLLVASFTLVLLSNRVP